MAGSSRLTMAPDLAVLFYKEPHKIAIYFSIHCAASIKIVHLDFRFRFVMKHCNRISINSLCLSIGIIYYVVVNIQIKGSYIIFVIGVLIKALFVLHNEWYLVFFVASSVGNELIPIYELLHL
jgi:hypothetical protein